MRILFMGTPDIAAECLKALYAAGHEICGVYTRRDKPVGRKQVLTAPPVKEVAMDEHSAKLTVLRERLIHGLDQIPYSELNGDHKHRLPGNVNFCFEGIEGESLLLLLDDKGICASSGSACTSGSLDPSHVLLAIGRPHEVAHGSLRLSLGEDMTEADIDEIILAVTDVVNYLRNISPFWRDLVNGKRPHIFER